MRDRVYKDNKLNCLTDKQKIVIMNSEMAAIDPLEALYQLNKVAYMVTTSDDTEKDPTIKFLIDLSDTFQGILKMSLENQNITK